MGVQVYLDDELRVSLSNVGDYYVHRKLSPQQCAEVEAGGRVYA